MSPGRGRGLELGNITKAVADSLGDRVLIELGEGDGSLWAVIGDDGGFELRELGPIEQIHRELESLRFAMRRLARRGGSPGIVFEIARRLDNRILAGFEFAGRPVMVVPTPSLYATPWAALPSLRNSDITVSPSAELWLKRAESRSVAGSVVVAAGPGLEHADLEVEEVAGLHDEALVWGPAESAVDEVVDALDGSALAHIASHAVFEYENPMFSSLQLADGDLYVYDLEGLARPPGTVVLSACDSGFTESRAGDELLGLSASLLAMGTRTVVASIGLVPDSAATRELMVEFHRALLDGVTPSQALRAAQRKAAGTPDGMIAAASFICIGGG